MRHLWLFYFPLLFLPNLGYSRVTGFGTVELSDFLVGPYIMLLLLAVPWGGRLNIGRITPLMGMFIAWASISTLTVALRYGYADSYIVVFGMLKIAKMLVYGIAGILTARAVSRSDSSNAYQWSLLGAAIISGFAILSTGSGQSGQEYTGQGYTSTNGTSVMMAILFAYIAGGILTGAGTRAWRIGATASLVVLAFGWALSDGRGGWLAAAAAIAYFAFRLGVTRQLIVFAAVGALVFAYLFQSQETFRVQVESTIFPTEEYGLPQARATGPIDDGGRVDQWIAQAKVWDEAPIMGTGIWHRGGETSLYTTGSHNYWLQMFLETGAVGGLLIVVIVVKMWKQATGLRVWVRRTDIPLKAALVAAFVGGMGETYFYGGIILFTLLAVYAPTGGSPLVEVRNPSMAPGIRMHPPGAKTLPSAAN